MLIDDESLKTESPEHTPIDRGPAHAYQLPVRIANGGGSNNNNDEDAEAEERLPLRLRGVRAAYGRALGTAGKLCLDKHASTLGGIGHPESAAQAWEHLTKAAEVRDTARLLLRRRRIYYFGPQIYPLE